MSIMIMKRLILIQMLLILAFVVGIITGGWLNRDNVTAAFTLPVGEIYVWEASEVERAYNSGDIKIILHSLDHFSKFIEKSHKNVELLMGEETWKMDLAFTYTRLALLQRGMGNKEAGDEFMSKAISVIPWSGDQSSREQWLISTVDKLDKDLVERTSKRSPDGMK